MLSVWQPLSGKFLHAIFSSAGEIVSSAGVILLSEDRAGVVYVKDGGLAITIVDWNIEVFEFKNHRWTGGGRAIPGAWERRALGGGMASDERRNSLGSTMREIFNLTSGVLCYLRYVDGTPEPALSVVRLAENPAFSCICYLPHRRLLAIGREDGAVELFSPEVIAQP
jgi:hypothetical protein